MCDRNKYNLISVDNGCEWDKTKVNISTPDLTSIITALENRDDLSALFSNNKDFCDIDIVAEQLNSLIRNLDSIRKWFDRTLIPSIQLLDGDDVRRYFSQLNFIDGKLTQLATMTKKIMREQRKKVNRRQKWYEIPCSACDTYIFLSGCASVDTLENHVHVADYMCSGRMLTQVIVPERDSDAFVSETSSPAISQARMSPLKEPNNSSDNNSANYSDVSNNSPQLCLYNSYVRNVLYPPEMTGKICSTDLNYQFYTVQSLTSYHSFCMICEVDLYHDGSIFSHVGGQKHRQKLSNSHAREKVIHYHRIFSSLPPKYQMHQVLFRPYYKPPAVFCKVCPAPVFPADIINHLFNDYHRERLHSRKFAGLHFYLHIVQSLSAEVLELSDDDSEEVSLKSQVIYNSDSMKKCLGSEDDSSEASFKNRGGYSRDGTAERRTSPEDDSSDASFRAHSLKNSEKYRTGHPNDLLDTFIKNLVANSEDSTKNDSQRTLLKSESPHRLQNLIKIRTGHPDDSLGASGKDQATHSRTVLQNSMKNKSGHQAESSDASTRNQFADSENNRKKSENFRILAENSSKVPLESQGIHTEDTAKKSGLFSENGSLKTLKSEGTYSTDVLKNSGNSRIFPEASSKSDDICSPADVKISRKPRTVVDEDFLDASSTDHEVLFERNPIEREDSSKDNLSGDDTEEDSLDIIDPEENSEQNPLEGPSRMEDHGGAALKTPNISGRAQKEPKDEDLPKVKGTLEEDSKNKGESADKSKDKSKEKPKDKPEKVAPKHNIIQSVKEKPSNVFDFLENRYQVHREFLKYHGALPTCTLCNKEIGSSINELRNHFISPEHKNNAKIHLGKQKFVHYCDLCYKYLHNEQKWLDHLTCIEHRQRQEALNKNREPRGGKFKEYECTVCNLVIYGNKTTINKHMREPVAGQKKEKKVKEVKLPQQAVNLLKNEDLFNEEIYKLSTESTAVLRQIDLSWQCCEGIQKALASVFGKCKAYPFGSRVSGLGNQISDLDVFVDTGYMYDGLIYQDADSQARLVSQTARTLKKHKDFADVFAIPNARTPIVQVYHKVTGLDCDLSFRHGLSVENTEYLRICIVIQPLLKPLILFLKRWSALCKMTERISTYALSMLAIFFLQVWNYLPSVKKLRELDPTEPRVIGGWKTFSYNATTLVELNNHVTQCNMFTRDLLCIFFEYYSKFKFNTEVVCPLLGHTVLKSDFYEEKGRRLPPEMVSYVEKINESEENEVFRSMSPMCIQDPFDLSHNLTKACPVDLVNKFVTLCRLSHALLIAKKT